MRVTYFQLTFDENSCFLSKYFDVVYLFMLLNADKENYLAPKIFKTQPKTYV